MAAIALHATLLPLAKWQPDEFIQFHNLSVHGWHAVAGRVFAWSPRPVSELLLWGYGTIVNLTGRPLIVPFLAVVWSVLLTAPYLAARRTREHPALVTLALVAAFLLLAKPGEMFFWPAAAAAYLVGLTALAVACLARSCRVQGAALVIAAWSDEIGAMVVLVDAMLLLALQAWPRLRGRLGWGMPVAAGAAACCVAVVLLTNRLSVNDELIHQQGSTDGHIGASLAAALPHFIRELAGVPLAPVKSAIAVGLAIKLMLFLGFRPGAGESEGDGTAAVRAVVRGLALLIGGLVSLVLAYRQFGFGCCERHVTFRADLIVLAIYSFAQAWPARVRAPWKAMLLGAPLAGLLAWRLPDISADRALIPLTVGAAAANWQSGRAPGPAMEWRNAPIPHLVNGWLLNPGNYRRTSDTELNGLDWRYFAVLVYFNKSVLRVEQ